MIKKRLLKVTHLSEGNMHEKTIVYEAWGELNHLNIIYTSG